MAFNDSGTYVLPAGNPVLTGTTITSTWANNTLNDIATALTTCVTRDGQSPPTANLPMGSFKITGLAAATANGDAVRYEQVPFLAGTPLPVASGGTGAATLTANNVLLGNGTSAPQAVAPSTSGNVLTSNGTTWQSTALPAAGVTSFNAGTTGLTPATATSGAVTLAGTLAVANGGTNLTTVGTSGNVLTSNGTTWQSTAPAVVLAANTFTAAQEWATGASIASASTINLNTATGNRVHITGTTTITAVTLTRGPRTVIFDGILTLTHNDTTNNLPGAANITTAAGDRAIYESDGTNVYCISYIKASGASVVSAGLTVAAPVPTTSGTQIGITGIPAGIKQLNVSFNEVSIGSAQQFLIRLGTSSGISSIGYATAWGFIQYHSTQNTNTFNAEFASNFNAYYSWLSGTLTFILINSATNTWCCSGTLGDVPTNTLNFTAGTVSLSSPLTQLLFTSQNGSANFNRGSITLSYL